ncbi:hypothetical protein D9M70_555420 [compost metagenome]
MQERATLGGARYFTDGLRAVMFFVTRPLSLSDLEILDWEPYVNPHGAPTSKEVKHAHE